MIQREEKREYKWRIIRVNDWKWFQKDDKMKKAENFVNHASFIV